MTASKKRANALEPMVKRMLKLTREKIAVGVGALLLLGTGLSVTALPPQPNQPVINPNVTMNRAETELIETIKTACKAIVEDAANPGVIAAKFGRVVGEPSLQNNQIVRPFSPNYKQIRISTRGSLPAPPYPAYLVEIQPFPEVPLSITALQSVLGEYRRIVNRNLESSYSYSLSFLSRFSEFPSYQCVITIQQKNADPEWKIERGTIVNIGIKAWKSESVQ
jgi:hypothetical protein